MYTHVDNNNMYALTAPRGGCSTWSRDHMPPLSPRQVYEDPRRLSTPRVLEARLGAMQREVRLEVGMLPSLSHVDPGVCTACIA